MNNLKSYTEYAVSTSTTDFVIGFDFNYGTDAVNVTVDDVPALEAGYSVIYLNSTTMRLSPAVPTGVVRLQRETDIDVPDNQFTAGAKFIASNMDENFTQLRHAQQEVRDGFSKLSDDTYEIIDTLQVVGQAAQDAADAAEQAAQTANDAAAQVNDKVSYQDLDVAVADAIESSEVIVFKHAPESYGAMGDGITVDNAAFSALMATKPDTIEADPNATYLLDSSSIVTVGDSCVFNGNGCTIIMDQRWNIQKTPMWGSQLSEAAVKGQTVLKMAFMTNWEVGDEVLVFQNLGLGGAAIDPYFLSVADDKDNGEYSSHMNSVVAVDKVNNTITLRTPLEFNAPIQTAVYKVSNKKLKFKNVKFAIRGNSSGFRLIDNCDFIEFDDCDLININATPDNISLRINTCYMVLFKMCRTVGVNISIEYGSNLCGQVGLRGTSLGFGDAVLMIWCASTNCFSVHGDFKAGRTMNAGSISAAVYLGAKTRNCISVDDSAYGLPYGFRAQWGAVNPKFVRSKADMISIYSLFSDYSHNVQILDGEFYDKPIRTVGVHSLTMRGNLLDSKWRGEAGEIPLMLDLNRGNDTTMVRDNYVIEGNTIIGRAISWVALKNSSISNNPMITSLRCSNGGDHQSLRITGNTMGNFYSQNLLDATFSDNTVDHAILQAGTVAGSDAAAVHFYSKSLVNVRGNTIKHPTCGVKRTTPNSQVNCITDGGGNNIIAPTQWDTGVDDTTAPTISSGAAYLSRGLEYKSNAPNSKVVWRYSGSAWVKGFTANPQLTYTQGSFPNTPNGLTTFGTTRTIAGAEVGDAILVSTNSADIGEVKGKYFARVTSPNTVTVYYQDYSGVQENILAVSITLTLLKS